jgi:hypothetical protein
LKAGGNIRNEAIKEEGKREGKWGKWERNKEENLAGSGKGKIK